MNMKQRWRRLAALSLEHAILYTARYTVVTLKKKKLPLQPMNTNTGMTNINNFRYFR